MPPEPALDLLADLLAGGHEVRVRVTGRSMSPFLLCGDTVTLRRVAAEALRPGDVVLVADGAGPALLHRVIRRSRIPDGGWSFVTKGDAAAVADAPVPADRVLGRVVRLRRGEHRERELLGARARLFGALLAVASRHVPRLLARVAPRLLPGAVT